MMRSSFPWSQSALAEIDRNPNWVRQHTEKWNKQLLNKYTQHYGKVHEAHIGRGEWTARLSAAGLPVF
ncbi:protein of unknown function [Agrobacterium pusense]|uniref:Uncharacterized protein n=1 Tax=Agrobacterium pusense TaxID=648995 RepID=U4Q1T6_9HYPH|nr:protein of unknown function [Agrobacterium pusense]